MDDIRTRSAQLTETRSTSGVSAFLERFSALVALVVLSVILSVASPYFLSSGNLLTVALQVTDLGLIALGQTFVIIAGGIDLSVGPVSALAGVVAALSMKRAGIPVGITFGLGVGLLFGLLSGMLVTKGRLHPFIATLGAGGIARGAALVVTQGLPVSSLPEKFFVLGGGRIFEAIPIPVVVFAVFAVVMWFVLNHTRLGRYTYAMGSNLEAARLAGIRVNTYRVMLYLISGFFAALAGIVVASRLISAQPTGGVNYELNSIAAVVLGGGSLLGGEGSIGGTLAGTFLMGVLRNGLNLLDISVFWQEIAIGIVLILAVLWDQYRRRHNEA